MDITSVISEIEAALATQLELAGGDPAVEAASNALITALAPAVREAAVKLAEQAAMEVSAQLPDGTVEVTLRDGEPALVVRTEEDRPVTFRSDELGARLTVRLPEALKADLEEAAGTTGDSVNTYVIKTLSSQSGKRKYRKRIQGTFET